MMVPVDEDEAAGLEARQAEVRGDLERLEAFGAAVPEVWTGVRFDGGDVVVLLTDPEPYRRRVEQLVDHPDRVHLRRSRFSRRHLDDVHRQTIALLDAAGPDAWTGRGPGLEAVTVSLRSTRSELAEQLHDRFGDAIEIRLGRHRFPLDPTAVPPHRRPPTPLALPVLGLTAEPGSRTYGPGDRIRGVVRFEHHGRQPIRLSVGSPAVGHLTDPVGTVVGGFTGAIGGVELALSMDPGGRATVGFVAGSDTFDPRRGAVLAPGGYLLVVRLEVTVGGELGQRGMLVTDPTPIELVAQGDDDAAAPRRSAG